MREYHQVFTDQCYKTLKESMKFIIYQGSSMSSTFQDMDVLYYTPNKKVRPSDVVVIKIPEYEPKIIHRVISVSEKGIRTMGDNNPHPDGWLLSPDQIMGSVTYSYRGRRRFSVLGGPAGLAQMFRVRLKHFVIKAVYPVLSMIYHNFSISSLIVLLIRPRPVAFKRPDGTEMHLLARGRVIGRRLPGENWQIKSPFRFFLDESDLPD